MDRTASHQILVASASRVARKVFASLPWNVRLAAVILKLADAYATHFGMAVYAAALYYGAEGLPTIDGKPASEFGPKEGESFTSFVNRFLRKPPQRDYGREFGNKFYGRYKRLVGERAEDVLAGILMQVLDTSSTLHATLKGGKALKQIESALFTTADNKFIDEKRKQKRQRTDGMPTDEEGMELDPKDVKTSPDALPSKVTLKKLEEHLDNPAVRRRVEDAANRLAPDIKAYFDLLMDGFEPREIYNLRLLPSMQKGLPEELRLDPTRENPFNTTNHKERDEKGRSNKQREKEFKEELAKYPHPTGSITNFLKYHTALMSELREVIGEGAED